MTRKLGNASTIPYIDPNPVPFTTLTLSTPASSSGPGGTPFIDNSISQQEAIEKAQLFLTRKDDSIVEKAQTPPSGNKHDFFSLSPYYRPDPNNPKDRYILKDGQTNPESTAIPDKQKLSDMTYMVKILSLAYHYTALGDGNGGPKRKACAWCVATKETART